MWKQPMWHFIANYKTKLSTELTSVISSPTTPSGNPTMQQQHIRQQFPEGQLCCRKDNEGILLMVQSPLHYTVENHIGMLEQGTISADSCVVKLLFTNNTCSGKQNIS